MGCSDRASTAAATQPTGERAVADIRVHVQLDRATLLDQERLKKSKALLLESNQSVTDIALSLGYHDPANFARAFKRNVGTNPSGYRASRSN